MNRAYTLPIRSASCQHNSHDGVKYGQLTIVIVVADYHFFNFSVLAHLAPKVLVERVKVVLQLAWVHLVLRIVGWVLIHVWEQHCLTV